MNNPGQDFRRACNVQVHMPRYILLDYQCPKAVTCICAQLLSLTKLQRLRTGMMVLE